MVGEDANFPELLPGLPVGPDLLLEGPGSLRNLRLAGGGEGAVVGADLRGGGEAARVVRVVL